MSSKNIHLCIAQAGTQVDAKTVIYSTESKKIFFDLIENFFADDDSEPEGIGENTVIGKKCLYQK